MALAEAEDARDAADGGKTKRYVATRRKHKPGKKTTRSRT